MSYRNAENFQAIATRLKDRGFHVVYGDNWANHGHGDFGPISSIVNHHTVDNGPVDYPSLRVVTYGRGGKNPLPGPLCNFGVGRHAGIYLVAAGVAYHAGAVLFDWAKNSRSVGIEIANNGVGEPYSPECWAAVVALNEEIMAQFVIPDDRVYGHKEVCSPRGRKIDPSFSMDDLRGALGSRPSPGTVTEPKPPIQPPVVPPPTDGSRRAPDRLPTLRRGVPDRNWVALVQRALNLSDDGVFGGGTEQAVKNYQSSWGLQADGIVGPATWAALVLCNASVLRKGEQRGTAAVEILQNLVGYRGSDLDGVFGPGTEGRVKQVQRWGGIPDDGVYGNVTRAVFARA